MDHTTEHQYLNQSTKIIRKSILVIGGAGYIGSHICKTLYKNGYTPIIVGRDIARNPKLGDYGDCYQLDFPKDVHMLDELHKRYQFDTCIHTAAYTAVGASVNDPKSYYQNNLIMTIQLLNKLIELDVKNFIFSSSAAVYGIPATEVCVDTEQNLNPINPYGQTKLMVEKVLHDYYRAYGLKSVSLRFFNVGGADPDGDIGEDHEVETHIIPIAIEAGFKAKEFYLNGDNYNTPDGTCIRDYVHVMDIANAHLQAVRLIKNKFTCESFNIGTGIGMSNKQILDAVQKHTGAMKIITREKRAGDPDKLIADISNTSTQLEWKPKLSTVDIIVRDAVKWYKQKHIKEIN
jgi:UDP-glucose 4-epimerase